MVWDADLPAGTTKLRNAPTVIQDNNHAIEEADSTFRPYAVNLVNRGTIAPPIANPPATIAQTNIIYSRTGAASGKSELFSMNPTFDTQITSDGRVGSPTTGVTASGIQYSTSTFTNTQSNMVSGWAQCSSAGGLLGSPANIASNTRTGTGRYTIATSAVFSSADVAILLTCHASVGDIRLINWISKSYGAGIVTITVKIVNENDSARDENFDIMILGGV